MHKPIYLLFCDNVLLLLYVVFEPKVKPSHPVLFNRRFARKLQLCTVIHLLIETCFEYT